jgi:hypothetical protein
MEHCVRDRLVDCMLESRRRLLMLAKSIFDTVK